MAARLLLLEDDPTVRALLTEFLGEDGHDVRACRSPLEVRALALQEDTPCLALVDAWGESHQCLTDAERAEIRALGAAVPTIMLTARMWARHTTAAELGLLALVPKPFDVLELSATVRRASAALARDGDGATSRSRALEQFADEARAAARCDRCEADAPKLYAPPAGRELGSKPPRALCFFCFLHLVGTKPPRASLVPR